jgi:pantothenate kinase
MDNPKLAHDRRGIHWTFDGDGYLSFISSLRTPVSEYPAASESPVIQAPSFDHALKDPTPQAIQITPKHRIVIIEGLYTFLSIEPWCKAGALLDERWYIEISSEHASRRLVRRHVATGVAKDMVEAQWRSDENDMPST